MISEHDFASRYASVWNQLTPMSDGYWKVENMLVKRESLPMAGDAPKNIRGVVNEAAFRAFCTVRVNGWKTDRVTIYRAVENVALETVEYIGRLAPQAKPELKDFDEICSKEAVHLAMRLLHFFPEHTSIKLKPKFNGCGLLSECEGDVIFGDCLYEVKAGDRGFRITDLRQLLVYSALEYSTGSMSFNKIGLFNPRTGSLWVRTLDQVCQSISGRRAVDTLSALVNEFSFISVSR